MIATIVRQPNVAVPDVLHPSWEWTRDVLWKHIRSGVPLRRLMVGDATVRDRRSGEMITGVGCRALIARGLSVTIRGVIRVMGAHKEERNLSCSCDVRVLIFVEATLTQSRRTGYPCGCPLKHLALRTPHPWILHPTPCTSHFAPLLPVPSIAPALLMCTLCLLQKIGIDDVTRPAKEGCGPSSHCHGEDLGMTVD